MTRKDIINEIADRPPIEPIPNGVAHASGGPGVWAALITILGVVLILTLSTYMALQQAERDRNNLQTNANISLSYETILSEIRAAVQSGPEETEIAILSLINDNRRIHGCKPVESISQLSTAPTCTVVRAPAVPAAAPTSTSVPTTAPATTTTTPSATSSPSGTTTSTIKQTGPKETPPGLLRQILNALI